MKRFENYGLTVAGSKGKEFAYKSICLNAIQLQILDIKKKDDIELLSCVILTNGIRFEKYASIYLTCTEKDIEIIIQYIRTSDYLKQLKDIQLLFLDGDAIKYIKNKDDYNNMLELKKLVYSYKRHKFESIEFLKQYNRYICKMIVSIDNDIYKNKDVVLKKYCIISRKGDITEEKIITIKGKYKDYILGDVITDVETKEIK